MKFCAKCGHQLNSMNEVCPNCSYQNTEETNYNENVNPVQNNYNYGGENPAQSVNSTGMLIWSIVNLLCLCFPLGVAGLVFAILAKSAQNVQDAERNVKISKIVNIIGTVVGIIVLVLYFLLVVVAAGSSAYSSAF